MAIARLCTSRPIWAGMCGIGIVSVLQPLFDDSDVSGICASNGSELKWLLVPVNKLQVLGGAGSGARMADVGQRRVIHRDVRGKAARLNCSGSMSWGKVIGAPCDVDDGRVASADRVGRPTALKSASSLPSG